MHIRAQTNRILTLKITIITLFGILFSNISTSGVTCDPGYVACGLNFSSCCIQGGSTCPTNEYACGSNQCCTGCGCPTSMCGCPNCSSGWYACGTGYSCCDASNSRCGGTCSGSGGGGGIDAHYVHGFVWEDTNLNGVFQQGIDKTWAPSGVSCADNKSGVLKIQAYVKNQYGDLVLFGMPWDCDGYFLGPPGIPIYAAPTHNGGNIITLTPPSNYPCEKVTWERLTCDDRWCTQTTVAKTGNGCVVGASANSEGYINFKIVNNPPPLACITGPTVDATHKLGSVGILPTNQAFDFSLTATDAENQYGESDYNLGRLVFARRPTSSNGLNDTDPETLVAQRGGTNQTSLTLNTSTTITPNYNIYFPNAFDEVDSKCTGRENIQVGWGDCDPDTSNGKCDRVTYFGDNPPECAQYMSWPTDLTALNTLYTFPANAKDIDGQTVSYDLDSTCGSYPYIHTIRIHAEGENSPQMILYVTDSDGVRRQYSTTSVTTKRDYDIPVNLINATMIEIVAPSVLCYLNSSGETLCRNLTIYNVKPYAVAPATLGATPLITFIPGDVTPTRRVYYETAPFSDIPISAANLALYRDGMNTGGGEPYSVLNNPTRPIFTPGAHVIMRGSGLLRDPSSIKYAGTLRFPMMWRSPAVATANCSVTLTPRVALPYYDGNACTFGVVQTPRLVTGKIMEVAPGDGSCTQTAPIPTSGVTAQLYLNNTATLVGPAGALAPATGAFSISSLYDNTLFNTLCINGTISSAGKNYNLSCVKSAQMTCSVGGLCTNGVSCVPSNALATGDVNINLGFTAAENFKWFTTLDGDFFAKAVTASVAASPATGFTPNLINTKSASSIGGFGFSDNGIDTQNTGTQTSEKGGDAQNLATLPPNSHSDEWLNKFSFTPPDGAQTEAPALNAFEAGKVYSLTADQFNNDILASQQTYTITGGTAGSPKVSIVYINDGGDIAITDSFKSLTTDVLLILVTQGTVTIDPEVGLPSLATYTTTSTTQLDLYILAAGEISTGTKFNQATNTADTPLITSGGLISKTKVALERDLGSSGNVSYPAELINFYPYILSLIPQYEFDNGTESSYTGLATFDTQFNFGL